MNAAKNPKHGFVADFFQYQFGDATGQIRLAFMEQGDNFNEFMAQWPEQKNVIAEWALSQSMQGRDVYYTPALYVPPEATVERNHKGKTAATRPNVQDSQVVWVDIDGNGPSDWAAFAKEKEIPEPSLVVQSSVEGHQHVYWRLSSRADTDTLESINRGLSLRIGADNSGWDATQLLRIPFTDNHGFRSSSGERKAWHSGESVEVSVVGAPRTDLLEVGSFDAVKQRADQDLPAVTLDNLPKLFDVITSRSWTEALRTTFQLNQEEASQRSPDKRSGSLQRLAYEAVEAGFRDDETIVLLEDADARWGKYSKRKPEARYNILSSLVKKARDKTGVNPDDFSQWAIVDEGEDLDRLNLAYGFEDFMNADVPETEWIFDGLMPRKSFGFVTAQPGVGKTQLSLQISLAAARGKDFLGHTNNGRQKVLFFSFEMLHAELRDPLRLMTKAYERDDRRDLQRNLHIVPSDHVERMPLDNKEGREFFEHMLSELKPDIVVIDSLSEILSKSVNDDETALSVTKYLNRIRHDFNTTVVVIHHNRKISNEAKKSGKDLELSDLYGSQWWSAKAQWVVALQKTHEANLLRFPSLKMRAAPDFDGHIRREVSDLSFYNVDPEEELAENEVILGGFTARSDFGPSSSN